MHANTAASINTKKTGLHPTTDSALRPIVLMVINILHSSTNGTDCCCAILINIEIDSKCPEVARKRRPPTTVHVRERESDKGSVRNTQRHQCFKNRNLPDKAAGRFIEFSNDILKNCTKVKTDVENCRLLQHPLLCKALSKCLHSSRSK